MVSSVNAGVMRALKGVNVAASTIISSVSNAGPCLPGRSGKFSAYGKVGCGLLI